MHPIDTDDPSETALPYAGENLLINKVTGQRRAAAPAGSLLLTSVPFGWRGIIVEQHRLPPMEPSLALGHRPRHLCQRRRPAHLIRLDKRTRRMERQDDQPWSLSDPHAGRIPPVALVSDLQRGVADPRSTVPGRRCRRRAAGRCIAFVSRDSVTDAAIAGVAAAFRAELAAGATVTADVGMAINPLTLESQFQGGIVYGLSQLVEGGAIPFTDGRVDQRNFDSHTPPYMKDAPVATEVYIVPSTEPPTACGECPVPVISPAVVNALFRLTGKRYRTLPLANL